MVEKEAFEQINRSEWFDVALQNTLQTRFLLTNQLFFSKQYGQKDELIVSAGVGEMGIALSFDRFLPFLRFLCFRADCSFKA